MKVKFTVEAIRWFDKINGNTYHSVKITNNETGEQIAHPFTYGYGDSYRQSTFEVMLSNKWLPEKYNRDNVYEYERQNDYPIQWIVSEGLKRDCIAHGLINKGGA